jgi:hypothetical protein
VHHVNAREISYAKFAELDKPAACFISTSTVHSPPTLNVMELGFAQTRLHHVCLCEHDATDSRLWHQGPKLQARRGNVVSVTVTRRTLVAVR